MKWWAVLAAGKRTDRVRKQCCLCKVFFSGVDFTPEHTQTVHTHTIDITPLSVLVPIWMTCLMWSTLRRIIDVSANTIWLPCERLHFMALLKKLHENWVMKFQMFKQSYSKDRWMGFIWNKHSVWLSNRCIIMCDWSNRCSSICTPLWQTQHIRAIKVL